MTATNDKAAGAEHVAEIDRLMREAGADVVHVPAELPSIRTDPGVMEAGRKMDAIADELRKAEAELAELEGDGYEEGRPGLLPKRFRNDPEAARVHLEAASMLDGGESGALLQRLARFAELKRKLPVLKQANKMARGQYDRAADAARRKLYPAGEAIWKPAVVAATRAYLRALVQLQAANDLFTQLQHAQIAATISNPFSGRLPANAYRSTGLPDRLAEFGAFGLTAADVEEVAAERSRDGHIAPGDLARLPAR